MRESIIRIRDVKKIYQMGSEQIHAIDGVSMNIYQGEVCCLLGKSGSGKSTLLNLIAGLEKPTEGKIIFHKKHIERMDEDQLADFRRQYVGFVFQSYNLLPTMTAAENVALPLMFRGMPKKARQQAAARMLELVGLKDRMNHYPGQMSGGQQQRVGIARAFAARPAVVYADEPTGNLDSKTTIEVMEMIRSFARKFNQTIIMVSHDAQMASYADRILTLKDGEIISDEQRGTSNEET